MTVSVDPLRGSTTTPDEIAAIRSANNVDAIYLRVLGQKSSNIDIVSVVLDLRVELSMSSANSLTLEVWDEDYDLLNSGRFTKGIDVEVGGEWFRYVGVDKAGQNLSVKFLDRKVVLMMAEKKKMKAVRGERGGGRAAFVLRLVRSAKGPKTSFRSRELGDKQKILKPDKPEKNVSKDKGKRDSNRDPGFSDSFTPRVMKSAGQTAPANEAQKRILERVLIQGIRQHAPRKVLIAAYMCVIQESNASPAATNGVHVGLFQQDPRYWPASRDPETDARAFYAKIIPNHRANPNMAPYALVESVQGSGQGHLYAQWRDAATSAVDNFLGGTGAGGSSRSYTITRERPYQFRVNKGENHYDAAVRLAGEVNRAFWFIRGVAHYESEQDLIKSRPIGPKLREGHNGVEVIDFSKDARRKAEEVQVTAYVDDWKAPIGACVEIHEELEPIEGRWLVDTISRSGWSDLAEIRLRRARREKAEPAPETDTSTFTVGGSASSDATAVGAVHDIKLDHRWGGSEAVFDQFVHPFMKARGLSPGSQKRTTQLTSAGLASDHWTGSTRSYATDYPTFSGREIARDLSRAMGHPEHDPNTFTRFNIKAGGRVFSVQILFGPAVQHTDHVHVGIRAV